MTKITRSFLLCGVCFCISIISLHGQTADSSSGKSYFAIGCNCQSVPAGLSTAVPMLKGIWMFSYRFMDMKMDGNYMGTSPISDEDIFNADYSMAPRDMNMQMHMLMGMYGITPKFTAMVMINYAAMNMQMDAFAAGHQHGGTLSGAEQIRHTSSTSGISDSKAFIIYSFLKKGRHNLNASLGLSIPTGNIKYTGNSKDMYAGVRQPYMSKLGSGSWDVIPGITYLASTTKLTVGVQVSGIVHTAYNPLGFKQGDELNASSWLSYRWSQWISNSLRVGITHSGKVSGYDTQLPAKMEPSTNPGNYGGTRALANIGLNFTVPKSRLKNTTIVTEFGLPVYQNVNGIQQQVKYVVNAGIDYMF